LAAQPRIGTIEPVIAGVINADPVPKALHLLEQVVVAVFRYYEFSDQSINTKTGNEITMALVPAPSLNARPGQATSGTLGSIVIDNYRK
jgi:hypothetical protein